MTKESRKTISGFQKMTDEENKKNPKRKSIRVKEGVEKYNIS